MAGVTVRPLVAIVPASSGRSGRYPEVSRGDVATDMARQIAEQLAGVGHQAVVRLNERPGRNTIGLALHLNPHGKETRLLANTLGACLAARIHQRLRFLPQTYCLPCEVVTAFDVFLDFPFVLVDMGEHTPEETGVVLCPFDRLFWILGIVKGVQDYLREVENAGLVHQ